MNSIFRTSEHCWSICFCLWLCSYILCNFLRVIEYYEQLLRVFFQVADSLDLDPIPSAYQIRFKGCKGMLAIDPSLPNGDVKEILLYRKSMDKFSSTHPALEICEATKPSEMDKFCFLSFNKNVVFPAQAEHSYFSDDFKMKIFLNYSPWLFLVKMHWGV